MYSEDASVRVSEPELTALIQLAQESAGGPASAYDLASLEPNDSPETKAEKERHNAWVEEDHKKRDAAKDSFKQEYIDRLTAAFDEGRRGAISKEVQDATNARSYVLFAVVAALVLMPIIAMLLKLDPTTFGTYLAPITGIAGTIVGYWFGTADRDRRSQ
jgi:hypothetical protein